MGTGLVPAAEPTAHLNGVRDQLLQASDLPAVPGQVYVCAGDEFHGYTTPGSSIYLNILNMGLLRCLENEDEVAAVLAHELPHSLLGHYESSLFVLLQKHMLVGGQG